MDFVTRVVEPILMNLRSYEGCKRTLIGNSIMYRNLFSELFDKSEMKLEELPEEEKKILWNESKERCPDDTINWCKAVKFYESF